MSTPPSVPTTLGELEWDLLLSTSAADPQECTDDRIPSLLNRKVNWEAVLRLGDEHGTSSLLYQSLSRVEDLVPSSVLGALRKRHEGNVHKSLFLARELVRILDRLDAFGIEVIPYNELTLSEVYYGDMALRH